MVADFKNPRTRGGHSDLSCLATLHGDDVRLLDTNPMSKGYPAVVKSRVADITNRIANGTMPFIEWGTVKQKYAKGENRWSGDFVFPPLLRAPLANEDVLHIICNSQYYVYRVWPMLREQCPPVPCSVPSLP